MSRPPLIGVTTSEMRRDQDARPASKTGEPPHPLMALGMPYPRAIELAGGIPVVLFPVADALAGRLLERLDGLCLSGGPDIDPPAYGAERHPELGPVEPALDEFELTIVREAVADGVPVLGICRGLQMLNVALGGTLHQHLPEVSSTVQHRQEGPGTTPSHHVRVEPGSEISRILGTSGELAVNSFHHQGIDGLASCLRATAWAPDGTIEAAEAEDGAFALGVQWHAETLVHLPEHAHLFSALVRASARRGRTRAAA